MFEFNLEGGIFTSTFYTETKDLRFEPPVYEQRYCITARILEHELFKGKLKTVVDFGCAELKLFEMLKRTPGIEHILEVDIDETLLTTYTQRARPLVSDYLARRETPLRADIYMGSIDSSVDCLRNIDAVIGIEIIEHLYPQVLENVPYNIFGYIQPKLVIFTTPNFEFNVLFNLTLPTGFRHDDHKFEWTRNQFEDWCFNICTRFPNYQVAFLGVGKCPESEPDIGYVSQIGVFIRNDVRDLPLVEAINHEPDKLDETAEYKLMYSVDFPFSKDGRNFDERLLDDIKYHIQRYTNMGDRFFNDERDIYEIPMSEIYNFLYPSVMSMDELKTVLEANVYSVDDKNMILVERVYDETDSNSSDSVGEEEEENAADKRFIATDVDEIWE